ncbi:recombinase family protein [Burkholderia glumae]|nr:recombinase family protein [Burkholderia glumae]
MPLASVCAGCSIDMASIGGRLVFHRFGALAEFERKLIRERTQAWPSAARRRKDGREERLDPKLDRLPRKRPESTDQVGVVAVRYGVPPPACIARCVTSSNPVPRTALIMASRVCCHRLNSNFASKSSASLKLCITNKQGRHRSIPGIV